MSQSPVPPPPIVDGPAGVPSVRTLGSGANQAAQGSAVVYLDGSGSEMTGLLTITTPGVFSIPEPLAGSQLVVRGTDPDGFSDITYLDKDNNFALALGKGNNPTDPVYGQCYLDVSTELNITDQIHVPSIRFDDATILSSGSQLTQWTTTGSDIYYSVGKVYLGTASPAVSPVDGLIPALSVIGTTNPVVRASSTLDSVDTFFHASHSSKLFSFGLVRTGAPASLYSEGGLLSTYDGATFHNILHLKNDGTEATFGNGVDFTGTKTRLKVHGDLQVGTGNSLFVDSTNNKAFIGTATPATSLAGFIPTFQINSATDPGMRILSSADNQWYAGFHLEHPSSKLVGMSITPSGVGADLYAEGLLLSGYDGTNFHNYIMAKTDGTEVTVGNAQDFSGAVRTKLKVHGSMQVGSTADLYVDEVNHKVGVGISSVAAPMKFQVSQNANSPLLLSVTNTTNGTAAQAQISVANSSDSATQTLVMGVTAAAFTGSPNVAYLNSATKTLRVATVDSNLVQICTNGLNSIRMTVLADGKVGINTVSPGQQLEVNGTIKGGGYQSSDGSAGITGTLTVKGSDGANHTITVKNGLITATTLP